MTPVDAKYLNELLVDRMKVKRRPVALTYCTERPTARLRTGQRRRLRDRARSGERAKNLRRFLASRLLGRSASSRLVAGRRQADHRG
jgi:hypothetical protein